MEPISTLAAVKIAEIAFNEFIKSGAGEAAKKSVDGAIELVKGLQNRIRAKFQGNTRVESALAEVEQQGSQEALEKVARYLDIEMLEDKRFAVEVQQLAHQIISFQNATSQNQQNLNYGRDQNIINQPQGNIKIGGA